MKKAVFFGLLAMVLAFGFIGCGENDEPVVVTYEGTANGTTYILKITDNSTYELIVGGKTSTGTVLGSSGNFTLTPTGGTPFTVAVSSAGITSITGTITFDDGSSATGPGTVTPPSQPNNGAQKMVIITGYPGSMESGDVHFICIAPAGTHYSNLEDSVVAWAAYDNGEGGVTLSNNTATVPLMGNDEQPWTGSGIFDVWIAPKGTRTGANWYKSANVSITQTTTTIAASSFVFITQQTEQDGGGGDFANGTMTVSNIPQEYVGGSYRLYVTGGTIGGGNNSGRIWSGTAQGNNMTTTPINSTTMNLPLNWRSGTNGNETLDVSIYITTDTTINIQGPAVPVNIIASKFLTTTFSNRNTSIEWTASSGNGGARTQITITLQLLSLPL